MNSIEIDKNVNGSYKIDNKFCWDLRVREDVIFKIYLVYSVLILFDSSIEKWVMLNTSLKVDLCQYRNCCLNMNSPSLCY